MNQHKERTGWNFHPQWTQEKQDRIETTLESWELAPRPTSRNRAPRQETENTRIINVNTASRDELMSLPGIGDALSLRIIENRPYHTASDLIRVQGIGERTIERIQSSISF